MRSPPVGFETCWTIFPSTASRAACDSSIRSRQKYERWRRQCPTRRPGNTGLIMTWEGVIGRCRAATEGVVLAFNRVRFRLFFKRQLDAGRYGNTKIIRLDKAPAPLSVTRPNLVIVRCGNGHRLIDDEKGRNFDLALNFYRTPSSASATGCEYAYAGGINKFQAARQFVTDALLNQYHGFMLLDDDLEISYTELSRFLEYCSRHQLGLAQPSLTPDSCCSHQHLLNAGAGGWRAVEMVEVMCPYFSRNVMRVVLPTFALSDSTWGLDWLWPRLMDVPPIVVDDFMIRHTQPVGEGAFYQYLRSIGVSPQRELNRLRHAPLAALGLSRADSPHLSG